MAGSRAKAVIKGCSVGCGALALLVAIGGLWLARTISSASGDVELTEHHPFRSAAAKDSYLARYDERAKLWPVPSETRMVETSWGRTFVRVSGPEEAPPLVLLPGASATSLQWMPNIQGLSTSYRTFAVDNIYDFGRSVYTRPITGADDFSAWLDELFSELDLGNDISLVGLSYGGWITSQYALEHPERLRAAVLIAPAGTVMNLSSGFIRRAILSAIPHRVFVRNLIYWLTKDSVSSGEAAREEIDAFVEDGYLGLRSFRFKPLIHPRVLSDAELASFEVPVLFLVGENERIYSADEAVARLDRVAPAIETEIFTGAGHGLTFIRADDVNARITHFLNQQPERAASGESEESLESPGAK